MNFQIDPADLQPLVEVCVQAAIERFEADRAGLPADCLALPEDRAGPAVGVARHVLRDARLRGEVVGSKIGKKIVYERAELLRFLKQQRIEVEG